MKKFLEFNCLSFNPDKYNNTKIKMIYTSMHRIFNEELIREEIKKYKEHYNEKFIVGLGTIAVGINGNEKILTPEELERDLRICKESGVKEVVIFRLGGLNKEYIKVMNKFN